MEKRIDNLPEDTVVFTVYDEFMFLYEAMKAYPHIANFGVKDLATEEEASNYKIDFAHYEKEVQANRRAGGYTEIN